MCGPLRENSLRRHASPHIVELAQHINQQDIENVPRALLSLWPAQACSFWVVCPLMPKHRTCGVIGKPISASPVMAGLTKSTSRASPGPRSLSTVCHARVLYCTATSTRTVSASSI